MKDNRYINIDKTLQELEKLPTHRLLEFYKVRRKQYRINTSTLHYTSPEFLGNCPEDKVEYIEGEKYLEDIKAILDTRNNV